MLYVPTHTTVRTSPQRPIPPRVNQELRHGLNAFHASFRVPKTPFAIMRCSTVVLRTLSYIKRNLISYPIFSFPLAARSARKRVGRAKRATTPSTQIPT